MLRLLKKWLKAGVSEEGQWSPTTVGTPQGAVILPLYANVFLHYVLDLWINELKERLLKFGLELHPDKTRLIEFGRYTEERLAKRREGPLETFDFLGFTHISGKTRRGDFAILRKTSTCSIERMLDSAFSRRMQTMRLSSDSWSKPLSERERDCCPTV